MQIPGGFDATKFDPQQGPTALPISDSNGWPVIIIATTMKPTRDSQPDNPQSFLEIMLEIIDGPFKGVRGADRLNLMNDSQEAVDIAYRRLSAYCHVLGKYRINQTEELHNQPLRVVVSQQKKHPEYVEISRILDINGNEPHKAGQGPPAAQAGAWTAPKENTPVPTGGTGAWTQPADKTAVDPAPASGSWQPSSEAPKTAPWNK